jgi:hypothetical protein
MVTGMTDPSEPGMPRVEDEAGNQIELGDDAVRAYRAYRQAVAEGSFEPSAPISMWWSLSKPDGGGTHIRVTEVDGRWLITDVYIHGPALTATDLQAVPLTQLDLIMNLIGYWNETQAIMDPDIIADVHNELAAKAGYGRAVTHNLDDEDEPSLAGLRDLAADAPPDLPKHPAAERARLTRPDGTDPDGFAARVAAAYREYATQTRAPAVEIAREAGVPVGTVRGWIREARRRGKLPEGRKGKAG